MDWGWKSPWPLRELVEQIKRNTNSHILISSSPRWCQPTPFMYGHKCGIYSSSLILVTNLVSQPRIPMWSTLVNRQRVVGFHQIVWLWQAGPLSVMLEAKGIAINPISSTSVDPIPDLEKSPPRYHGPIGKDPCWCWYKHQNKAARSSESRYQTHIFCLVSLHALPKPTKTIFTFD